jgi:hypothetical protein
MVGAIGLFRQAGFGGGFITEQPDVFAQGHVTGIGEGAGGGSIKLFRHGHIRFHSEA